MSDPPPRIGATARGSGMAIEPVVGFRFGPALEIGAPSNGSGAPADLLASIGDLTWTLLASSPSESPAWLGSGNGLPWDTDLWGDAGLLGTGALNPSLSVTGESAGLLDPTHPSKDAPEALPNRGAHAPQQTSEKESARLPTSVAPLRESPIAGAEPDGRSATASFVQQSQQEVAQADLPPSFIEHANANQVGSEAAASAPTPPSVRRSDPTRSERPASEQHLREAALPTPAEPDQRPSEPPERGLESESGPPDPGGGRSGLPQPGQLTSTDDPQTGGAFLYNVPARVEVGTDNVAAASSAETPQADSVQTRQDLQPRVSASASARNSSPPPPVHHSDRNATEAASDEGQAAEAIGNPSRPPLAAAPLSENVDLLASQLRGVGAAGGSPSAPEAPAASFKISESPRETAIVAHSEAEVSLPGAGSWPPTGAITEPLRSQPEGAVTPIVSAEPPIVPPTPKSGGPRSSARTALPERAAADRDARGPASLDRPAARIIAQGRAPTLSNAGDSAPTREASAAAPAIEPVVSSTHRIDALPSATASPQRQVGGTAKGPDVAQAPPAAPHEAKPRHTVSPGEPPTEPRIPQPTIAGSAQSHSAPAESPKISGTRQLPASSPEYLIQPDAHSSRSNRSNAAAGSNAPPPPATPKAVRTMIDRPEMRTGVPAVNPLRTDRAVAGEKGIAPLSAGAEVLRQRSTNTAPAIGATSAARIPVSSPGSSQAAPATPTRTRQEGRSPVAFSSGPTDTSATPPVIPPRVTIAAAKNTGDAPNAFESRAPQTAAETLTSAKMTGSTPATSAGSIVVPSAAPSTPSATRRREQGEAAPIRISIGRISVDAPAPPPQPTRPARARPKMSLNEYLKRRRDVP